VSQQLQLGAITGSSAAISECGRYRYSLHRRWGDGDQVCWIMLNPSTADAKQDDPTIRRCIGFSRRWGFGGLVIVNLFAWRATDPKEVKAQLQDQAGPNMVGPLNREAIRAAIESSAVIVAAWGASLQPWSVAMGQLAQLDCHYRGRALMCLGTTKGGSPRHPLYVKATTELEPLSAPPP
jgi:hypothetical protein